MAREPLIGQFLRFIQKQARETKITELLLWCLPALLLGLALRIALTTALPYAYFHVDTPDFIQTAECLSIEGKLDIHGKKSFFSPLFFSFFTLLGIPSMVTIPILQHLMGILLVLMAGALCRLWFNHWKLFIIPVTLLLAANPAMLWYEHTLMAETHFVFFTILLALAGSLYAKTQTSNRFALLCIALFLNAGARPEGKLLFGFAALLLVLLHWRDWRLRLRRFAIFLLIMGAAFYFSRTSQGGLLLYTSVAKFTPENLRCAPGFEPYIAPLRADLQKRWEQMPSFPRVKDRKEISRRVKEYLSTQLGNKKEKDSSEALCLELAKETCLRNLAHLPVHVLHKFRYHSCESPAWIYNDFFLFEKQRDVYEGNAEMVLCLSRGLFGKNFKEEKELLQFIDTNYRTVSWFNRLSEAWYRWASRARLQDEVFANPDYPTVPFIYKGLPFYMIAAALGLIFAIFRPGELQRFHITWGMTLLLFVFVVILTANVRARFRFFLEPFWFLYCAMLLDISFGGIARIFRRAHRA